MTNCYYDPKPIPIRDFDWVAIPDDFDAELVDSVYRSSHPVGYGETEEVAIRDLQEQLQMREEEEAASKRTF
jgi:hypothetical protein